VSPIIFLSFCFIAAGCASNTIEEAVPQGALAAPQTSALQSGTQTAGGNGGGPPADAAQIPGPEAQLSAALAESGEDSAQGVAPEPTPRPANADDKALSASRKPANGKDGYPDLNVVPASGEQQISAEEKAAAINELKQAQQSQKADGLAAGETEIQRLRRLAKTNAGDVLREIEGK
jgi:hypothetical protein